MDLNLKQQLKNSFSDFPAHWPLFLPYSPLQLTNGFERVITRNTTARTKQGCLPPRKWCQILLNLQRRLTCCGDLQPSRFRELVLQATSLWELIRVQLHDVVRGRGMRRRVQRSVSVVNVESIVNVATRQE